MSEPDHVVPEDTAPERIDRYASRVVAALPSKARARKAAKAGSLLLNGAAVESSRFVKPGDTLRYTPPPPTPPKPYPRALDVVYVDEHLAVVVKPPGLLTNGNRFQTLEGALVHLLPPPDLADALPWPRPAHRLDFRTGGLVVAARSATAQIGLGRAFQSRSVEKRYRAIATGRLEGSGTITEPVEGRAAETAWKAVAHHPSSRVDAMTTVDLWPRTGRTHQLRRHLAHLGHPILGDEQYTPADVPVLRGKGLYLWAVSLAFDHPVTGERLSLEIPEPPRFDGLRTREARRVAGRADEP